MSKEDPDKKKGLYQKYQIKRLNDKEGKHKNCLLYVLDLNHDKFAIPALKAYIEACEKEYPLLANDLIDNLFCIVKKDCPFVHGQMCTDIHVPCNKFNCSRLIIVLPPKEKKEKKEFVPATKFQLELRHKDKECLIPVVNWLLLENASHHFEWEMKMLERDEEYVLYIETAWADNLLEIAKRLGDFGQNLA